MKLDVKESKDNMNFEHLLMWDDDRKRLTVEPCKTFDCLSDKQKKFIHKTLRINKNVIKRPDFFSRLFLASGKFSYENLQEKIDFENSVREEIERILNLDNGPIIA